MKIRIRLIGLLIFLLLIFLSVFIIQKKYDRDRLIELSKSVQVEREYVFDKILALQQKPLQTFVFDYSWWGEMANFVTTADKKWAIDNIDLSLNTYQANAAWVYNPNCQLVYSVNNLGEEVGFKEIPIPRQAISSLFAHSPFSHFFVNTSKGLMEFYGASIHDTDDVKREHSPKGYLFCSRLWTKSYLDELSQLTSSTLVLSDTVDTNLPLFVNENVGFSRILTSWDNLPVKYLVISTTSRAIASAKKSVVQVFVLFFSFSIAVLLILSLFIFYWVDLPLRLITLSLKRRDSIFLQKLKNQNTEFGDVARLMDSFFVQSKLISEESTKRKQFQDALDKVNSCFVSFGTDSGKNIQLITETAGQILSATFMFYNRSRDGKSVTEASWNTPPDFSESDSGQGHICLDVIKNQSNRLIIIDDLLHTSYAHTDPNVIKYNLQSYVSCPIRVKGRTVASLCAVFQFAVVLDEYHLNLLEVLGKAASIEEERMQTEEMFKIQALQLDVALKEALKSREVLLSMLEDNQLNKLKLEISVVELDSAYSKLKESQAEVIQSAKFGAIGQLASSVAHEVRNPLAIILQSIEYLENKIPVEYREVIQMAANSVRRANTIVGTLLDFSKAKELVLEPLDINPIIDDSLALTRYSNLQDKIMVNKELGINLPKVLIDRQKIEQVMVNIFLNAMQAIPGVGNIFVRTYLVAFNNLPEVVKNLFIDQALSVKNAVIIEIEDSGIGISKQNMQNIFRPFFTTKGAMTGIGLGLSVAKDIITLHNGHIEIESQEGKGTRVIVTLKAL